MYSNKTDKWLSRQSDLLFGLTYLPLIGTLSLWLHIQLKNVLGLPRLCGSYCGCHSLILILLRCLSATQQNENTFSATSKQHQYIFL